MKYTFRNNSELVGILVYILISFFGNGLTKIIACNNMVISSPFISVKSSV